MRLEIFHQLGYNSSWNFQSLTKDQTGDGVILAPRYMTRELIADDLQPSDQEFAIFDPQFFLPGTPKGELATYPFFPHLVADGFSTSEFAVADDTQPAAADQSARGCVQFQRSLKFRYVVIPTRYMEGLPADYIEKQTTLFVDPFLRALTEYPDHKPVLLQVILSDLMLKDVGYRADLLNWITGLREINGVYLIVSPARRPKQLKDMDLLLAMLQFIDVLSRNQMEVIIGYTNTEALLLSLADPKAVTVGCYENMRMFNIRTFEDAEKNNRQGPTPRVYVSRLLQWIDHRYVPFIQKELGENESFFDDNEYQAEMFQPTFNWHFSKPQLYKHAILESWRQLRHAGDVEGAERYERVRSMIATARSWYSRFSQAGIEFDDDSDGSYLAHWLTVANSFAKDKGWR